MCYTHKKKVSAKNCSYAQGILNILSLLRIEQKFLSNVDVLFSPHTSNSYSLWKKNSLQRNIQNLNPQCGCPFLMLSNFLVKKSAWK